jgi:hypothetical protein
MDSDRFDGLARSVSTLLSRRTLATLLGFGAFAWPRVAGAKKKHKHKHKKKIKRNSFGCVNVGNFCTKSSQCCSGICQGQKGKKKCQAHDASTCQSGNDVCVNGVPQPCTTSTGHPGDCTRTTGNASYCETDGECFACKQDADCVPFCGAGAACIICPVGCGPNGTACVGLTDGVCTFPP